MKTRIVLSWPAHADLREIRTHLIEQGEDAWPAVRGALRAALARLRAAPRMGHARKDLTDDPVLFLTTIGYYIIYRPDMRPLLVVRILHAARDVRAVLRPRR